MKGCKCKCGSDHDLDIKMSVPKDMEFNTPYNMDHTLHNEYYWDTKFLKDLKNMWAGMIGSIV